MKKFIMLLLVLGTLATGQAQDRDNRNLNYGNRPQQINILSKADLAQLQDAIRKAPFADDKKNIFRVRLQNSFLTVDQVQEILKQFTFNDDKLDWAIMAYPYTADTQQYYRLRESFSFINIQSKFDQFLLNANNNERPHRRNLLSNDEFAQLQALIKKEAFAANKQNVFRLGVKDRYITVAQLSELLRQFTFDDDKLGLAIMAYPQVADKQQFYTLRERFSFNNTQNKFDQFLLDANNDERPYHINLMGSDEFAQLQALIKKEAFAADKQKVFRLAVKDRFITVAQLSELLKQLTFDEDKMSWAIMAYNYTADIQRFYQLRDLLTFDMNKQKLDKFLLQTVE